MKAYLWHDIEFVSKNYHTDGSVLIEAPTLTRAREIARTGDGTPMVGIEHYPDAEFESHSVAEKIWVFPNAGCC